MNPSTMRPRDSQRSKCYTWERKSVPWQTLEPVSISEAQALVDRVLADLNLRQDVTVKLSRRTYGAHFKQKENIIVLGPTKLNSRVTLHELAHALLDRHYGHINQHPWHGAQFVGIVAWLYWKYLGVSAFRLKAFAEQMNVQADFQIMSKSPFRQELPEEWM